MVYYYFHTLEEKNIFLGTKLLSPALLRRPRKEKWIGKLVLRPFSKWSNYSVLSNKKLTVGFI